MTFSSTDSVTSCIGFVNNKANGATPMSDDIIPDGDEWDRPAEYRFTAPLRMIEMLRRGLGLDVSFLSLNHFAILLIIFEMEDERFGIEAQEIHKLAGVEKSTANRIIHSLSDQGRVRDGLGYIRVDTDVNDRRIRRIFLTDKGRNLMEEMASAGTALDAEQTTKMQQAFNANRLLSLEKAQEPQKVTQTLRSSANMTAREIRREGMKSRMALDRKMRTVERQKGNYINHIGEDALLLDADQIRSELQPGGMFEEHYELTMMDGYWMVFDSERLKKGKLHPRAIQRNLRLGMEQQRYTDQLVIKINQGFSFSDTMYEAQQYLNATEYNRIRSRLTKELAQTRDELMKNLNEFVQTEREKNDYAVRNRQQAGARYDDAEKIAKQAISYPVHMLNEKMQLIDKAQKTNRVALEQVELADKLEVEAEHAASEADALRKQLDANTKAMAEMQAMMKQMLDNK
jgi:DNA-binding MarR family transcriptional regulator